MSSVTNQVFKAKSSGWGGRRRGAGRKCRLQRLEQLKAEAIFGPMTAVEFLTAVYRNPDLPVELRVKAAIAAAPYQQAKLAPKKQEAKVAAEWDFQ